MEHDKAILVALGSNLESPEFGAPEQTLEAALGLMPSFGIAVAKRSSWYRSAPVPPSDQPWFVNGVAKVETKAQPVELLAILHSIEERFGRRRVHRNESRILDLDLLAFGRDCRSVPGGLMLPHPRIAERAFVLLPLRELVGAWHHPITGQTPAEMLEGLSTAQEIQRTPQKKPARRKTE